MPRAKATALKNDLEKMIADTIGSKTAAMYCDFFDSQSPEVAMKSAEELLTEFVGSERAAQHMAPLKKKFHLAR